MATVGIPSFRAVFIIRTAISPLFATRSFLKSFSGSGSGETAVENGFRWAGSGETAAVAVAGGDSSEAKDVNERHMMELRRLPSEGQGMSVRTRTLCKRNAIWRCRILRKQLVNDQKLIEKKRRWHPLAALMS